MAGTTAKPAAKPAAVAKLQPRGVTISSIADVRDLARLMYEGGCQPNGVDRPDKLAVIILTGLDVGLSPTQAVGSIMLTGGKPSIYGDGALALVRASGLLEFHDEGVTGEGDARVGWCKLKRKGEQEREFTFSYEEAKTAGLIAKSFNKDGKAVGPWSTYSQRMLVMRARGYALRDVFPDILRGLITFEEANDALVVPMEVTVNAVTTVVDQPPPVQPTPALNPSPSVPPEPTTSPAPVGNDGPITEAQTAEIRRIFGLAIAGKGSMDEAAKKAFLLSELHPFGVESAKAFTAAVAAKFIETIGSKYDPFTYGPKNSAAA